MIYQIIRSGAILINSMDGKIEERDGVSNVF